MLDPSFIRDHVEEVRTGLRNRGLDPDKALEEIVTLETARRRLIPEVESLKRAQNTSGDEIAKARRMAQDTAPVQEASPARGPESDPRGGAGNKAEELPARVDRASTDQRGADPAEPAARQRAGRQE